MKSIKSFDYNSATKYGIAINTYILTLSFPFLAIHYISALGMSSDTILAFLMQYSFTFFLAGIIGGATIGLLCAFTYNLLSPYFGTIKAEAIETETQTSETHLIG